MMVAFTFIFWGTGGLTWQQAFEISGSSLTTLGFAEPNGTGRIWLAFIEATIGLGLVALLISYLPTIYSAYNGREKGINRLRPIAGVAARRAVDAPPDPAPHRGASTARSSGSNQSDWMLDLEQTHTAFPILSYFPETAPRPLVGRHRRDAARRRRARGLGVARRQAGEVFEDVEKGPADRPRLRPPADRAHRPGGQHPAAPADEAPGPRGPHRTSRPRRSASAGTSTTPPWRPCRAILVVEPGREEEAWRRFAWIRSAYEPALRALAGLTLASPAPWTTDRPATVGRPRFLRRRPLRVDWSQAVPPAPAAMRRCRYRWLKPPDSSLVIDTVTGWRSKWAMDCFMSSSRSPARSRLTPWRTRIRWTEMSETEPVSG